MDLSHFIQEHRSLACHGNQHVPGSLFLQLSGIWDHILSGLQLHLENLPKFMVIRLDQERAVLQNMEQELSGSVYHCQNPFPIQPSQNIAVNGIRHGSGNTSCQYQNISFFQSIQLFQKLFCFCRADIRSLTVDLCPVKILHFHVDPGIAILQIDKITGQSHFFYSSFNLLSGKSC